MPQLEIHFADGRRETSPLSRTSPLTVGAQTFNDVAVPEPGVPAFYCRIGWNKTGFEVTAATSKGVDLNGTVVEHSFLKPGDTLRVGSCDLIYRADGEAPTAKTQDPEKSSRGKVAPSPVKPPLDADDDEDDAPSTYEGPVLAQSMEELSASDVVAESIEGLPVLARSRGGESSPPATTGVVAKIGRELQGGRKRPGEQEILKSPVVLALGGVAVVLLLIAGTIWFLMGREISAKLYAQAERDLADGKYAQAIEQFDKYALQYPSSSRALPARIHAAKARVQRELSGATPAWSLGWERLQGLVREFRNTDSYPELLPVVRGYAEEIAVGAARTAEQTKETSLLTISAEAAQLMERSASPETPLGPVLNRIRTATSRAEAAIAKQNLRDASVATMRAALAAKHPIDALAEREDLLRKFPEYRRDKGVEEVLQQALAMELGNVAVREVDIPADNEPGATPALAVLPVFHARSRTSDASLGQIVWVLAQDSCYAVDTMTGEVVWRRVIGFDPPFSPVEIRGEVLGWLMFDGRTSELVHCRVDSGQALWRQKLTGVPRGSPVVDEGQIYLVTSERELLRIDVETGAVSSGLDFSQPVSGPPVLDSTRQFLFVAGERGLIYALRKRPLKCATVTFTDHASGAIQAPLVSMGRLLMAAENDRATSARLRLWDASDPMRPLPPVLEQRVEGLVFDAPVLRGPQLVVPLQGERVSAFLVNDEAGRAELKLVGTYRIQDGYAGPLHVTLGPDQQFWLSSTAFRRFEIAGDSIRLDPNFVAAGLTTQPLQAIGETFFVARRARFAEGVQFTNIDRNTLTGSWRTVVGASPAAALIGDNGSVTLATESGVIYNLGAGRLKTGGIERTAGVDLEWPVELASPPMIGSLADGRVALAIAGDKPRLWLLDPTGRLSPSINLAEPLEHSPLLLSIGLVLPVAGRLTFQANQPGQTFEDWRAPIVGDEKLHWAHLISTADDEFLAIDNNGNCRRMQLRTGESVHLAEVAAVEMNVPAAIAPLNLEDSVVVVDVEQVVRKLNQRTLEPGGEYRSPAPILGIAVADGQLLVWDATSLRLLDGDTFAEVWNLPLVGRIPVGRPLLRGSQLWMGCENGAVLAVDRATGQESPQPSLPQALSLGVVSVGESIWGVACDGTLYRISMDGEAAP